MEYNFKDIEKKWQDLWAANKTFKAEDNSEKPKYYVLDMFPYPSGAGLHVGHPLGYIASDIIARYKRHKGFNVLHPMGYDSFGLPAEQYAIQTGQHPAITTEENINRYRQQLDKIGFSFDWDREVRTSNPDYYKWTQWIFIQIFNSWYNKTSDKTEKIHTLISEFEKNGNEKVNAVCDENVQIFSAADWKAFNEKEKSDALMAYRIAYLGEAYVNWCPALGTVLANDEIKDGVSERGGHPVERKLMKQWSMRITAYAQRLLNGLDTLDWTDSLKEAQRNWIGKSEGTSLRFSLIPNPSPKEKGTETTPNWQTANKEIYALLKTYARNNKKPLTESEDLLWQELRNKKLGFKFRRQHPIDNYIADFICLEKKLIIEVDGEIHLNQKEKDNQRTLVLNQLGFEVIRFTNNEVKENIKSVLANIKSKAESAPLSPWRGDGGEADKLIEVFTTRPDTIFGVSFVTLAPEHDLVSIVTTAEQKTAVEDYVIKAKNRSERERQAEVDKVSGVFTGSYVKHPFTGKKIPIWVGDYVLAGYGTGAVMAVPAHDERDFKFANHFGLELPQVIEPTREHDFKKDAWGEKEGKLINSDFLNGLEVKAAIKKAIEEIEKLGIGQGKINYRLRDAVFGRQRYWGEPIPIYYKPARRSDGTLEEGGNDIPYALEENELPLLLPEVDKYLPTEDGEPPLARANNWKYKNEFAYEHSTMPGWAGSSWYFLRYMDAKNNKVFAEKEKLDYWKNVDLYIGGSEHATGHLLYVRFWTKALKDLGFIDIDEPAQKLINQGMITGTSEKMIFEGKVEKIDGIEVDSYASGNSLIFKGGILFSFSNEAPENTFYSQDVIEYLAIPINKREKNVDVSFTKNSILDVVKLSELQEYKNSAFICKAGAYFKGKFYKNEMFPNEPFEFKTKPEVEKMSKSKYNVVSPDDICEKFGADTLRLYEMFLGPLEQSKPWNTNGITGVHNFLKKLWRLFYQGGNLTISEEEPTKVELKILHKTIKKITEDIERFSFNTSVSNFMICVNELTDLKCNKRLVLEPLVILISPYAPHITEELWHLLGHKDSIIFEKFPEFNSTFLIEDNFTYPVSFNGKMRFNLELPATLSSAEIEKIVLAHEHSQKYLEGKTPKKVIVVPKKIVNIVV